MTAEQQRELWLKRVLPALGVLVLYFVIISPNFVTEKTKKAEAQYISMKQKGIDAAALPGIAQQQSSITEEVAKLEQEDKVMHEALAASSSFMARSGSSNDALERISVILANNNLQVLDEKRNDKPGKDVLPRSLRDTQHWLKDILAVAPAIAAAPPVTTTDDKDLNVWTIRYIGSYLDNYRALLSLIESDVKALPVSLSMQPDKSNTGRQEWLLTLWI